MSWATKDQLERVERKIDAMFEWVKEAVRSSHRSEMNEGMVMSQVSDVVAQVAADVQANKDAFASVKTVLASQSQAITDLKAQVAAGADTATIVASLTAIDEGLKGTNADMLAAAALANTPAASSVPADAPAPGG